MERSLAIVKMLSAKTPQAQCMLVHNDCFRCVSQSPALKTPAIAEFSIFTGGERETCVEASHQPKCTGRASEIVRGKELGIVGNGVVIIVYEINQDLAGGGKGVVLERIDRCSAEHNIGLLLQDLLESAQPVRMGATVIIGKGQEIPAARAAPVFRAVAGPACGCTMS